MTDRRRYSGGGKLNIMIITFLSNEWFIDNTICTDVVQIKEKLLLVWVKMSVKVWNEKSCF